MPQSAPVPSRVSRTTVALAALVGLSLVGDFLCRTLASPVDREKLLESAAERVSRLPSQIGSWRMKRSAPLPDETLQMLRCRAHENRVYMDDQTGETVSLVLMTGTAGPLVAHTPEVCYSSVDFETIEPAHPEAIRQSGSGSDVFDQVTFRSRNVAADTQRVFYGWRTVSGSWVAPKNPRLSLGGEPLLYKVQLTGEAPPEKLSGASATDPARRFLKELLPALDEILKAP